MSATLVAVAVLALGTFAFRSCGPLLHGRVALPTGVDRLVTAAAVVLLVALVATSALTQGGGAAGIARPAGVLTAGLLAWRRTPFPVVVVAAAVVTAGLRLLGLP